MDFIGFESGDNGHLNVMHAELPSGPASSVALSQILRHCGREHGFFILSQGLSSEALIEPSEVLHRAALPMAMPAAFCVSGALHLSMMYYM